MPLGPGRRGVGVIGAPRRQGCGRHRCHHPRTFTRGQGCGRRCSGQRPWPLARRHGGRRRRCGQSRAEPVGQGRGRHGSGDPRTPSLLGSLGRGGAPSSRPRPATPSIVPGCHRGADRPGSLLTQDQGGRVPCLSIRQRERPCPSRTGRCPGDVNVSTPRTRTRSFPADRAAAVLRRPPRSPGHPPRRLRIRRHERLRWTVQDTKPSASPAMACATPVSIRPRCARRPAQPYERTEPPLRSGWAASPNDDVGPGRLLAPPNTLRAVGRDAEAQRILDGAVRQVSRGPGLADVPDGAVRQVADAGRWVRDISTASSVARPTSGDPALFSGTTSVEPRPRRSRATT